MKVYVVSGYTDIHNCGYEAGGTLVFSTIEKAIECVKRDYDKWRKEYESELKDGEFYDCPPNETGARFRTDRDDIFDWSISEAVIDEDGISIK